MAFPTAVNSQITDSASVPAPTTARTDAAALVGQVYAALAQSTGMLFEISVSAQQQLTVVAASAMTLGANQILHVDTAATAAATEKVAQSDTPDNMLALLTALRAKQADAAAAEAHAHDRTQDEDARVARAVREAASALQAAMDATGRAIRTLQMDILRNAALGATLNAMIRNPEQAAAYAPVLKLILELD